MCVCVCRACVHHRVRYGVSQFARCDTLPATRPHTSCAVVGHDVFLFQHMHNFAVYSVIAYLQLTQVARSPLLWCLPCPTLCVRLLKLLTGWLLSRDPLPVVIIIVSVGVRMAKCHAKMPVLYYHIYIYIYICTCIYIYIYIHILTIIIRRIRIIIITIIIQIYISTFSTGLRSLRDGGGRPDLLTQAARFRKHALPKLALTICIYRCIYIYIYIYIERER